MSNKASNTVQSFKPIYSIASENDLPSTTIYMFL